MSLSEEIARIIENEGLQCVYRVEAPERDDFAVFDRDMHGDWIGGSITVEEFDGIDCDAIAHDGSAWIEYYGPVVDRRDVR